MYSFKLFTLILLFSISLSYGEKFPPLPQDRTKLPAPIQKEITNIANLCKLDTLEQKVRSLERSIEKLRPALHHYTFGYPSNVNHGLIDMSLAFHEDEFMVEYWRNIFNKPVLSYNILHEYLNNRARNYNLSAAARDPKTAMNCFSYHWEHDVYRGFYCMTYGTPPPKYKRKIGHSCW